MKLAALNLFSVVAAGFVAAQVPTNGAGAQLLARDEDVESFYATRAYDGLDSLSHARRTLEHMRSLAQDHAEFVARALDHFENLDARGGGSSKPPRTAQEREWDREYHELQKKQTKNIAKMNAEAEQMDKLADQKNKKEKGKK